MKKIAEKFLVDADKFPVESIRETLARTYGIDAVALSGPCEGQNLVSCVVNQLEKRWDKIKDRFAGNMNKVHKLATKIGESYMQKDDTKECTQDLEKIGYKKEAASGIASYIKAYAIDIAADEGARIEPLDRQHALLHRDVECAAEDGITGRPGDGQA